jgi:hypothetical protein
MGEGGEEDRAERGALRKRVKNKWKEMKKLIRNLSRNVIIQVRGLSFCRPIYPNDIRVSKLL